MLGFCVTGERLPVALWNGGEGRGGREREGERGGNREGESERMEGEENGEKSSRRKR